MDGPWNKINIPFPSAVSVYRIPYSEATDTVVQYVVAKSEKFLQMFCSEVLQTEIRVLYDVLYVINNSFRRHKPFRALKQVEQCINRVKEMKLQEAVQDLWVACPKKAQRTMGLECGECEVPSQAILEWTCVKMVGGAHLLTCLLDHCSRAFILIRRHLQTGDFLILNLLLISMLSRLWVLFRGLLRALLPLYQCCLELLEPVSSARPLPYLSGCTLPAELATALGPSGTALLDVVDPTGRARRTGRRGARPTLLSRLFGQEGQDPGAAEGGRTGTRGGDLAVTLQEVIQWCRDRKLSQERRSLAFMCVKCRRMVSMEADGQSVTRRLQLFQRALRWGLLHGRWRSPQRRHSLRTLWRQRLGCRASFRTLRNHYGTLTQKNRTFQAGSRTVRAVSSKHKVLPRQPVDSSGEEVGGSDVISAAAVAAGSGGNGKSAKTVPRDPADANEDDIDDIFASIGF
ncbi:hypothetical protein AALO_G00035740 [Alosa alosa]|uniref:Nucleolus and neural progenitor protein-like N-terminal domain-containing protein n=1 Tax=Alosa alosa TaxID=278164 RepID=A0AAV6H6P9_9TELE|nr:hypothetical protein AALO_G00035740 [Alosa alosa]